ncbi:potassium channel family protein [Desulfococcus multivorans]|uniref:TrkA-N domain protein n=1 Tax=Desulfococcus multivorans DSM 2059 TaxID=1121405 RepID=S7VK92_DESML|nr:potassium channel protein [Desulfococcus multivorans]AOY59181.1 TrkA-N domain protein [Desulfococcus multivorans]AQV01408.1 potassium transporter TrkA [Desulfococcus multivorans]EPR44988.1 TrkA-N domain protein [Desulfococcus multivorans DSM 2059]SJZ85051.1 Trk K+ transport system, NAD-binding component [Desulfococcus multivorans DSM 2059]
MKTMTTQLALLMQLSRRKSNMRLLIRFSMVLILFFALYTVLFHVLMLYEGRRYSWITGLYWTLTTMSTLGFGDITFSSDIGKFFSVVVLLSGIIFLLIILPFTFIQFFYAPWLDEQNKARAPRAVAESLSGHLIFTYFDAVAVNLIQKLGQYGINYVILTAELQKALDLHDQGYAVVVGDLDDPQTYHRLNIDRAAMVIVLNDDVASTNIIFTIREANANVVTVTNADADDSLDILEMAGSTHVLQFTKMLGQALARRVHGVSMKANVVGRFDQLLIAEAPVMRTWLQGKSLAESRLREVTGVTVVGIWEEGQFRIPGPQSLIGESTVLVLAGTEAQLDRFDRSIGGGREKQLNSGPVVVLGGGRVGMAVANTLKARDIDYRVVEKKTGIAAQDPHFIQGSAADLETLVKASIHETPSVIITTHDDNLNIYLTIYCRRLRPDVQIISRASLDRNINTLHRAGANLVMSYSSLVTATILNLLHPQKILMLSEGLNVFRTALNPKLENKALLDIQVRENTQCSVVAVKRGEDLIINPDPTIILEPGDELLLIGLAESEKKFIEKYPAPASTSPEP